jgi:hypothetical protein
MTRSSTQSVTMSECSVGDWRGKLGRPSTPSLRRIVNGVVRRRSDQRCFECCRDGSVRHDSSPGAGAVHHIKTRIRLGGAHVSFGRVRTLMLGASEKR